MLPGANVQSARPLTAPQAISSASSWATAHWVETQVRDPNLLAELGIPLRCFHADRGYFFACYLPERGWYWVSDSIAIRPERWAVPVQRSTRRQVAAF